MVERETKMTATEDRCATPYEACKEYAANVGRECPERPWILTNYDTWEKNPCYRGPACLADTNPDEPDFDFLDLHADCAAHRKCYVSILFTSPP